MRLNLIGKISFERPEILLYFICLETKDSFSDYHHHCVVIGFGQGIQVSRKAVG